MRLISGLTVVLLFGCAAQTGPTTSDAVADFIVVSELEELDIARFRDQFHTKPLGDRHAVLEARGDYYLVLFGRRCHELNETDITPDRRFERNTLRAGIDTIRGCRIDRIFAIDRGQAQELELLGKAPGK